MKWLLKVIEAVRPNFEEGGKLRLLNPVFGALEHFFFAPSMDLKRFMSMASISVVPCALAALYLFGLRFIAIVIVSYAAGLTVETLFAMIRKEGINEGFFVTGIYFALILPPNLPLWMVAFGVFVGKELFGGTGRNLFNAALVGRCFLSLAYPKTMSASWAEPGGGLMGRLLTWNVDSLSSATPLAAAKQGEITSFVHMFLGNISGSAGETSALLLILGGVFLLITRVANWRSVVSTLGSFAILTGVLMARGEVSEPMPTLIGSVLWQVFAGGLLFGAFFMTTDPVTSPTTNTGKWFYGIVIGSVTVLIRNFTGYVEGVTFAILLGNIVAPILDEIVIAIRIRRLQSEG